MNRKITNQKISNNFFTNCFTKLTNTINPRKTNSFLSKTFTVLTYTIAFFGVILLIIGCIGLMLTLAYWWAWIVLWCINTLAVAITGKILIAVSLPVIIATWLVMAILFSLFSGKN
jgi:hypothetical protein